LKKNSEEKIYSLSVLNSEEEIKESNIIIEKLFLNVVLTDSYCKEILIDRYY